MADIDEVLGHNFMRVLHNSSLKGGRGRGATKPVFDSG
jgi:hypothetical protein